MVRFHDHFVRPPYKFRVRVSGCLGVQLVNIFRARGAAIIT